jgi:hypothetical protein
VYRISNLYFYVKIVRRSGWPLNQAETRLPGTKFKDNPVEPQSATESAQKFQGSDVLLTLKFSRPDFGSAAQPVR